MCRCPAPHRHSRRWLATRPNAVVGRPCIGMESVLAPFLPVPEGDHTSCSWISSEACHEGGQMGQQPCGSVACLGFVLPPSQGIRRRESRHRSDGMLPRGPALAASALALLAGIGSLARLNPALRLPSASELEALIAVARHVSSPAREGQSFCNEATGRPACRLVMLAMPRVDWRPDGSQHC